MPAQINPSRVRSSSSSSTGDAQPPVSKLNTIHEHEAASAMEMGEGGAREPSPAREGPATSQKPKRTPKGTPKKRRKKQKPKPKGSLELFTIAIAKAHASHRRCIGVAAIIVGLLLFLVAAALGMIALVKSSTGGGVDFLLATSQARFCTFDECIASKCDPEIARYLCLAEHSGGSNVGGCSPSPWSNATCDDECDVSACRLLDDPPSVDSCADADCGQHWCDTQPLCADAAPYQCTEGPAQFGCSADTVQWTRRVDNATCSGCCDTTTCAR